MSFNSLVEAGIAAPNSISDWGSLLAGGGEALSTPVRLILLVSALSLVPTILIATTAFTRIIIVLAMLRHALGMPETPPTVVLVSLALFLTAFTMAPVIDQVNAVAVQPFLVSIGLSLF